MDIFFDHPPRIRFYWFWRGEWREQEMRTKTRICEKNIDQLPSHTCPFWGSKPAAFWCAEWCSKLLSYWARAEHGLLIFKLCCSVFLALFIFYYIFNLTLEMKEHFIERTFEIKEHIILKPNIFFKKYIKSLKGMRI